MSTDDQLRRIFETTRVIASVGLSTRADRASHPVAFYLQSVGFKVIPVNPTAGSEPIIGERVYPDLRSIPQRIDVVQVFRKPEDVPAVVDEAIAAGAKVVWMQQGISHPDAAAKAEAAGLQVVMDRCMMEQHLRLFDRRPLPAALALDHTGRRELWRQTVDAIEAYYEDVQSGPVTPQLDAGALRDRLGDFTFEKPVAVHEALAFATAGLWQGQIHTSHPRYFGLFNPASAAMGVAADALASAFNAQLAAWEYNPFGVEVERHLVRAFAVQFGYPTAAADGTFTSGGSEANHTAMITALVRTFPEFARGGVAALGRAPVLYVSTHAHRSYIKAARACGLGSAAVRRVPVDETLRMDVSALAERIASDRAQGAAPFFIAATAGAPFTGAIDPLTAVAELAEREGLWFHADAAWAGAVVLVPDLRPLLAGIERADSITFDPHKWLGVPMGAGLYLTRHADALPRAFSAYDESLPPGAENRDPFQRSLAWSRRFVGLKVFLSLAVAGWDGYRDLIRGQVGLGDLLRAELTAAGWRIVAPTPLPLVCFVDGRQPQGGSPAFLRAVSSQINNSGEAWITSKRIGEQLVVLRACITNYRTGPREVHALVRLLEGARESALHTLRGQERPTGD